MGGCDTFLLILITIIFPPAGVAITAGCGVDLLINILLTCLGYIPGHIHAFYIEYKDMAVAASALPPVPGVYSDRVRYGGTGGGGYQKEVYQDGYVAAQAPGQTGMYSSGNGLVEERRGSVYY
ncbi:UPF0057-domain-containing protein [Ascobolus immersus RN42]|uniref:UPF0057-domain-containing protein n=1 Tax=Ascobolus immersus RN42 TaxID=1160509 RepID=A0A3N4I158_ASCIM|nr:UPF0057-domain-containing protein [Ascobolus immersus RN42]